MIDIYKLKKGITVKHKVGTNDDIEMVFQFSSSSPNKLNINEFSILGRLGLPLFTRKICITLALSFKVFFDHVKFMF